MTIQATPSPLELHESPKTMFDHKFSGYSVWVEPCPKAANLMRKEMVDLMGKCGGEKRGVYTFEPHCTLLYNTNIDAKQVAECTNESNKHDKLMNYESEKIIGERYLLGCLKQYKEKVAEIQKGRSLGKDDENTIIDVRFDLVPTSLYYFHYPKEADDGRGFGCVILLILLDNKTEGNLELLHHAVSSIFPPDERHGEASGKFTPHMSLIYAPETETWLEEKVDLIEKENKTFLLDKLPAKYLTLWRTEGEISEWYKIAQVEII